VTRGIGKSEARKDFFLKKEAKTFPTSGTRCRTTHPKKAKVFWFFFSKKNSLPFPPPPRESAPKWTA
jgi:hypothetical protein